MGGSLIIGGKEKTFFSPSLLILMEIRRCRISGLSNLASPFFLQGTQGGGNLANKLDIGEKCCKFVLLYFVF